MNVTVSVLRRNKRRCLATSPRDLVLARTESSVFNGVAGRDISGESRSNPIRLSNYIRNYNKLAQLRHLVGGYQTSTRYEKVSLDRAISSIDVTRDARACLSVIKKAAIATTSASFIAYHRRSLSSTTTFNRNGPEKCKSLACKSCSAGSLEHEAFRFDPPVYWRSCPRSISTPRDRA
jgi:hypothetical protein